MENDQITDDNIMASSSQSAMAGPEQARLHDRYSAWSPGDDDDNPFLEVYLGETKIVTAISTQGHPLRYEFVRQYLLRYSMDGQQWLYVTSVIGVPKVSNVTHPL
jgi:hypothetical protein